MEYSFFIAIRHKDLRLETIMVTLYRTDGAKPHINLQPRCQ